MSEAPIVPITNVTVEHIQHMGGDVDVARAAWISTSTDEREKDTTKITGLLKYLMANHHGTPFEHTSLTVRVHAPIMVFREWHRHRIQSFNESSGRYSVFEPVYYMPGVGRPLINIGTSARPEMAPASQEVYDRGIDRLLASYEESWDAYNYLLGLGWANEMSRLVMPVGIYSSMYATANLRAWMHFLGLRTTEPNAFHQGHPQWEIVQCAKQVEEILKEHFPISMRLFDELGRVAP